MVVGQDPAQAPRIRLGALLWAGRARSIARSVAAEPLTHFLLFGFLLFVASRFYQEQRDVYEITITPGHVAQLARDYALQFGSPPDKSTLDALTARDIHDEILFRQGLALNLDQGDEIVRRRVVQKMQFLMQDLNAPAEPTDAQLEAYFKSHASHYVTAPRATFSHIYFSTDLGGDAQARAHAALATLSDGTTRAPQLGDPFPDLYDFSAYEPEQVSRVFGRTPMADAVFSVPIRHWSGPFRSGYGWHLVFVDARQVPDSPQFSAVRDAVRSDYLQDAQNKSNQAAFDELARRFTIIRKDQAR